MDDVWKVAQAKMYGNRNPFGSFLGCRMDDVWKVIQAILCGNRNPFGSFLGSHMQGVWKASCRTSVSRNFAQRGTIRHRREHENVCGCENPHVSKERIYES